MDSIARPIKIFCDSSAAISFANNNKITAGCKYLDTKFLVVREKIDEGYITIEYISTKCMIADPMTKGLAPGSYTDHVKSMGLISSFDV